ncbi:sodium/glutamate symporter [Gilvimarinus chinensis]|uniref:sodium/glutamate symporter n=1 Tax=Gilvimarinus chinensis TaxID=396005 RepID=UPI00036CFFCC|nr:sodium/glutamate symporter [Gilvimarinus chinensis]
MQSLTLPPLPTLTLSILVLFLGLYLNRRFAWLERSNIPPSVTGGIIFSLITASLYFMGDVQMLFDMQIRDFLLLVFFSTIGLSAKLNTLSAGGRALAKLVAIAAVFLLVQDITGVLIAWLWGVHPGYGLMAGSVSFAGGHGTAIAWGQEAEAAGLLRAGELGIAFATFGLVMGGMIGGPIARFLIQKNQLYSSDETAPEIAFNAASPETSDPYSLVNLLRTIFVLALCIQLGRFANDLLANYNILLPGFLTAMFSGIVLTNAADACKMPLNTVNISKFGQVSLSLFLAMSLMALQLWSLERAFTPILLALAVQTLVMTLFALYVVFHFMGRDYDAAVITSGFAGLGLGATPVAIANMDAITTRFGPSQKAFLVIPLVGAFFIDILNAAAIKFFIGVLGGW